MLFPPIIRSLYRCREQGLSPELIPPSAPGIDSAQQQLLAQARSSMEDLYQMIEQPGFAVLLADPSAIVLEIEGDRELVELARSSGLIPLIHLDERRAGTNAVDLALREAQALQTVGTEHYSQSLHKLAMAAAPLFCAAGRPMGALAIVTHAHAAHPHTLGMVIAAAQSLHNQLRADQVLAEANDQLAELYAALEAMSDGLIFVGPTDEVRRINSRAAILLGVSARSVAGHALAMLNPPPLVCQSLAHRQELAEQELIWQGRKDAVGVICAVRPVWDRGRRYLGTLVTLRPVQSIHQLVRRVVGAEARFTFHDIIGQSPAMTAALNQARLAAYATGSVLLRGEPGVGKEIFAQAIHRAGSRAEGPFIGLNCAAVPRPLLAGELFGVEGDPLRPGQPGRPGKLELAYGGVLFLEEVTELPLELQTALLRTIEMRRVMRSDSTRLLPIDVRVIVTAGADLERQTYEGRFRADLLARLSSLVVEIPPLRERGDDLLLLVNQMLQLLSERLGRQLALAPTALQALRAYPWPGNVRELELTLERALAGSEKSVIELEDLPTLIARGAAPLTLTPLTSLDEQSRLSEREAILRAGQRAAGHLGRTAALLGISRATLWRKMVRYNITKAQIGTRP